MHHLDVTVNHFLSSFSPLFGKFHNDENIICELMLRASLNQSLWFNFDHMDRLLISFYLTNTKLSKCHGYLQCNSMELLRLPNECTFAASFRFLAFLPFSLIFRVFS